MTGILQSVEVTREGAEGFLVKLCPSGVIWGNRISPHSERLSRATERLFVIPDMWILKKASHSLRRPFSLGFKLVARRLSKTH